MAWAKFFIQFISMARSFFFIVHVHVLPLSFDCFFYFLISNLKTDFMCCLNVSLNYFKAMWLCLFLVCRFNFLFLCNVWILNTCRVSCQHLPKRKIIKTVPMIFQHFDNKHIHSICMVTDRCEEVDYYLIVKINIDFTSLTINNCGTFGFSS